MFDSCKVGRLEILEVSEVESSLVTVIVADRLKLRNLIEHGLHGLI